MEKLEMSDNMMKFISAIEKSKKSKSLKSFVEYIKNFKSESIHRNKYFKVYIGDIVPRLDLNNKAKNYKERLKFQDDENGISIVESLQNLDSDVHELIIAKKIVVDKKGSGIFVDHNSGESSVTIFDYDYTKGKISNIKELSKQKNTSKNFMEREI